MAAASNNSMQPDVNPPDVSDRFEQPELFGLVQNGLFETGCTLCCLYRHNIPCYKWTCSLSGDRSDVSLPAFRNSSPVNAFLSIKKMMRQDSPSVSAKAELTSDKSTKHK